MVLYAVTRCFLLHHYLDFVGDSLRLTTYFGYRLLLHLQDIQNIMYRTGNGFGFENHAGLLLSHISKVSSLIDLHLKSAIDDVCSLFVVSTMVVIKLETDKRIQLF